MNLSEAKARLRIHELWHRLDLPGEPKPSCRCPFREDRNASFSVSEDGMLFNDFATGTGGDAVDFLQLATGVEREEACKRFLDMAGRVPSSPSPIVKRSQAVPQERRKLDLVTLVPDSRPGDAVELEALAALRRISLAAVRLADRAGLLRFGTWKNKRSWLVLDDERCNVQARRMDGQLWDEIEAKSQTLPGAWAKWPLGITTAKVYPAILLVEGGPDLLAALHFIHALGAEATHFPVAMLGAGQTIHEKALPYFGGKRVRIMAHADERGRAGAEKWAAQLLYVGARVDIANFYRADGSRLHTAGGSPIKDLNDCTLIHPDDAKELEGLLP